MFYIHKRGEGTGDEPLDYQLSDWLLFRATQKRIREEFKEKAKKSKTGDTTTSLLNGYMSDSRDRLGVDRPWTESADLIDWSYDVESQSQIQNWLEFLTWHVGRHKLLQRQGRIRIQRARRAQNHEWQEQYERRLLELHDAMLVWMEEQRVAITTIDAPRNK
ncbi:hypothetical protein SEUCBS140593_008257 [Sporothrix eucalyptigena]|uniref:Uncharacterized protein n=1 Tax=Sporothrix eucalyptigena TaxID=1812306 RepID=A0ABP0CMW8_9PEZI